MALSVEFVLYLGALGLVAIGLAGMVFSANAFRVIIALVIAEAGANLLLVLAGYRWDAIAPILSGGRSEVAMVDPVPQAMVLTAIVIGVGIQALALGILIRVREAYGTLDMKRLRELLASDITAETGADADDSDEAPAGERPIPKPGAQPGLTTGENPRLAGEGGQP